MAWIRMVAAGVAAGPLVPGALCAQLVAVVPELDADGVSALAAGEILVEADADGRVVTGFVAGVVDAPLETVWSVVRDFEGQAAWIPDLYDAHVVERLGDTLIGEGATSVPFPLIDRRWQIRVQYSEQDIDGVATRIAAWEDVPGFGNMDDNDGYWLLQPFEGSAERTLVAYRIRANPGFAIPDRIERAAQRRMFPGFIRGLREHIAQR